MRAVRLTTRMQRSRTYVGIGQRSFVRIDIMRIFYRAAAVLAYAHLLGLSNGSTAQELPTTTVTATRYEEDAHNLPTSMTVITRQEIIDSGANTVNEVIMRIGGVLGRPSLFGGNEYTLDLGGFGDTASSNTVVVIDGTPYKQGDSSEIRLSSISLDQVERIEIQRSASPVLYGEGAIAGVINIITNASTLGKVPANSGSVTYGLGSYRTEEKKAHATYSRDGLSMFVTALDRSSDGFRKQSRNEDQNVNASLQYRADTTRIGGIISQNKEHAQTPGGLTLSQFAQDLRLAQPESVTNNTVGRANGTSYGLFAETEMVGHLVRGDIKQRTKDYSALAVLGGFPINLAFQTQSEFLSLTALRSMPVSFGKNTYILGIESSSWKQSRDYPDSADKVDLNSKSNSIYLKNDLDIQAISTRISAGVRSENMERSQFIHPPGNAFTSNRINNQSRLTSWELGFSKTLTSKQNLHVRLSSSNRLPNIDEMGSATWDMVNSKPMPLNPQTAHQKEIGWKYKFSSDSRWGLRAYQTDLRNEIIYDPAAYSNINLDPTQRRGLDFDFFHRLNNRWTFSGALSLRDSHFSKGQYSGNSIPMSPKQIASIRSDWNFSHDQTIGINVTSVAKQKISGDFVNQEDPMPGYSTLDLRYGRKINDAELSILVRNIFDRTYYSYATNAYDASSGYLRYTSVYPDQRRSFMAQLKWNFR
jgi:iron complex outermembrane receptor protein